MPPIYEHANFFARLYDTIILPMKIILGSKETISLQQDMALELGLEPYYDYGERWRHGLVLVNNFFGFEAVD
jgi:hypothetical protein